MSLLSLIMPKEFQYSNEWAFYICWELDCGLFFRNKEKNTRPIIETHVHVPKINKRTIISFVGLGEEGWLELYKEGLTGRIFPVDLFSEVYKLDPKPSRTVDEHLFALWNETITRYKRKIAKSFS